MCNVKFCKNCKEYRNITDFNSINLGSKFCNTCINDHKRDLSYKNNYSIDIEHYNKLFSNQNGSCYICHTHQSKLNRRLAVDHNHVTGKVRGLLCNRCNMALGLLKENPMTIGRMYEYITGLNLSS